MASQTAKLQVNYKLADGTLINVYADSVDELADLLKGLSDVTHAISSTSAALTGGSTSSAVSMVAASLGGEVISNSMMPVHGATVPDGFCRHGKLVYRESKPGAPKTWKGWFCPSPKGTPDQCEPKFIR